MVCLRMNEREMNLKRMGMRYGNLRHKNWSSSLVDDVRLLSVWVHSTIFQFM